MLSLLHIENIAVIESADIVFGRGLNLLTGETGAGKSIVVDALGAIVGLRTSKELVRTGADKALVSAVFDELSPATRRFLEDNGISVPEGEELLVQREIGADGRNVCRVGGRPATVTLLRQLGELLLQIHGQHDSQALLSEDSHRPLLDQYAGVPLEEYRAAFLALRALEKERDALHMDEAEKARKIDALRYAADEIEAAELETGEDDELTARRDALRHAEHILEALGEAAALLSGDDDFDGALTQCGGATRALLTAERYCPEAEELRARLEEGLETLAQVADDIEALRESFDASPGELEALESRLDLFYRLKRKYGPTLEEVIAYGQRCRDELDNLLFVDRRLEKLEVLCAEARQKAEALAENLSRLRGQAGQTLADKVLSELSALDMPKVAFAVELAPQALDATGGDAVRFLLSANPGEPLRALSRVASGGELSRIMLALKNVLSEVDDCSIVFDEIDTGVSGRAAGRVAEKLGALSRGRQVLCVTHLPQITAMADTHFKIEKGVSGERTFTKVEALDRQGRIEEVARLIGGLTITELTRQNAAELLTAAEKAKEGMKK